MKVKLIAIGKTNAAYLREGEEEYDKRLRHYVAFETIYLPDVKNAKSYSEQQLKDKEGEVFLAKIERQDYLVLLDENGHESTSEAFAVYLDKQQMMSVKTLVFLIGGAFGFSEAVYQRSDHRMSLSKMTFSHQMVRLIFKEQLYRAFTIIKGEPYHHK